MMIQDAVRDLTSTAAGPAEPSEPSGRTGRYRRLAGTRHQVVACRHTNRQLLALIAVRALAAQVPPGRRDVPMRLGVVGVF